MGLTGTGRLAVALAVGLLAGCGGGPDGGSADPGPTAGTGEDGGAASAAVRPPTRTAEYLPGLEADVWDPVPPGAGPVVVLVPGGSWVSADRAGLAPLASALSDAGMTVVSATYRTSSSGTYFPGPLEDVLCAVAFAATVPPAAIPPTAGPTATGAAPHPLVVVGHSAGANLAALAALTPAAVGASCPYPAAAPDAFVGLAGPYDVVDLPWLALALFGVPAEEQPSLWEAGDPIAQAADRAELPVLLLHGEDDADVDVASTTGFAAALEDGGHDVTVEIVPGADHGGIYQAEIVGDRLIDWIGALG